LREGLRIGAEAAAMMVTPMLDWIFVICVFVAIVCFFCSVLEMGMNGSQYASFARFGIPIAIVCLIIAMSIDSARGDDRHSNPWLLSWIPATCCVTNDCCWEVQERELVSLPDDEWRVRSTGQVRKRTGWSPDGKFYRCACDYDQPSNSWVKHQGANTRCIFVPQRLF
jgi:hypothetical protein